MAEGQTHTTARFGFFPIVAADEVTVRQAAVTAALSAGNLSMTQGGGNFAIAGGNLSITRGGSNAIVAGGDVTIEQGGAVVLAAKSVTLQRGFVGVVLAADVNLEDSRIMFSTAQAAAFGAALGLVIVGLGKFMRRS